MKFYNKDIKDSDLIDFGQIWANADEQDKISLISEAADLPPGQGIVCVLAGINSYNLSIRTRAKQGLVALKEKILLLMADHSSDEELSYALKQSALFSSRIYNILKPGLSIQEILLYFETLLDSGGRGPFYAWKFWRNSGLSKEILEKIILSVSEKGRLLLVDQYLKSSPIVRRIFANEFKKILKSINTQESVVGFYAWLFDNNRYADPFLHYLNSELINPETIISGYLKSSHPEKKSDGIKFLSMITSRIQSSLLIELISDKEPSMVRKAVFNVVEKSPIGTYPELFDNIYKFVCKADKIEALAGFRALIVSRPFSLSKLVVSIRQDALQLMESLIEEISLFPRLSFFFIQELAINESLYSDKIMDLYKGLVYGMVMKRPERILKILEKYEDCSNNTIRMAVFNFVKKINESLLQEKEEIHAELSRFKAKGEQVYKTNKNKKKGIIKSFFSDSVTKKINMLKQGMLSGPVDFTGENIKNTELSYGLFSNSVMFNRSTIKDSDMSRSSFLNAGFINTFFCNVNLKGAKFDSISFDNSIFIDVNADNSEFINCSFQGAYFFNTSFKSSCMAGSIFVGSVISEAYFSKADLSGASFACAKISSVSFADSNLFQTDFTGIKAKFCRFPSHSALNIETDHADFNARSSQLKKSDLPDLLLKPSKSGQFMASEINLLILTEFIHFGKRMFLRQNKFSLLTALDIFKPRQADLFEIIPLLIHENIDFPGYDAINENSPHGISDYFPSNETGFIACRYLAKESLTFREHTKYYVESLFTIGSTGSIAQSFDSDIDYWVCVRDEDNGGEPGLKFKHKLDRLEQWALNTFKIEIHFFIVDIKKAAMDDFGDSTIESSGSAQGKILKEEFYRTMIYVAGKLPLWCTLPVSVSKNYYKKLCSAIYTSSPSCRYIDLGDIHNIPAGEYFGALIWQIFKWLKSPFKSVIKISLLEQFVYESGEKALLCNRFKDQWMNAGLQFELSKIDPYYILLTSLVKYYEDHKNNEAVKFVQLCFFLKIDVSSNADLGRGIFGFRKMFIMHCMHKWQWNRERVFKFGGFRHWQYDSIMKLSLRIEKYMVDTYRRVRDDFNTGMGEKSLTTHKTKIDHHQISDQFLKQSLITPEDIAILGRKIFVQFLKKSGKIEKLLLISKSSYHFHELSLRFCVISKYRSFWELVHKSGRAPMVREEILKKASTIEEIGAWFIHNVFYSRQTLINLIPNSTPVTVDDIRRLFNAMDSFFPHSTYDIDSDVLLAKAVINFLFISMNLCVPRKMKKILECSVVYMNSWGEMFFKFFAKKDGFDSFEELVKTIKKELKIDKFPEKTAYHFPKYFKRIS